MLGIPLEKVILINAVTYKNTKEVNGNGVLRFLKIQRAKDQNVLSARGFDVILKMWFQSWGCAKGVDTRKH